MMNFAKCVLGLVMVTCSLPAVAQTDANEVSNEVAVVRAPHPIYPAAAAITGQEGRCLAKFRLLDYGQTIIMDGVMCSAPIFCLPSRDAILGAEFSVTDVEGTTTPGARDSIYYPFDFALGESMRDIPDEELELCDPPSDETVS